MAATYVIAMNQRRSVIQVAIDVTEEREALKIAGLIHESCKTGRISPSDVIIEAGTPLIKTAGVGILSKLKIAAPGIPLLADMKTADVGKLEASLAYEHGADYTTVLAVAPLSTVRAVIEAAAERKKGVSIDFLGLTPHAARSKLEEILKEIEAGGVEPAKVIVSFHRGIDEGAAHPSFFQELSSLVNLVRSRAPGVRVSIAGGLTPELKRTIESHFKPDIYVVGRYITSSPSAEKLLEFVG
ncbi:MAG: orotidine 5'-phosphate decarboxylase / HUMPS family protein [Thermofilum sp.]